MSKVLSGLTAAAVVAVGGYFATEAYLKHRIANEIEANFAQVRASGGQARRGDLAFNLWHRTVAISDISVDFPAPRTASIKVGRFSATGIGLTSAATFSAANIALTDVEAGGALDVDDGMSVAVKAPRFEISDYTGPTQLQGQLTTSAPLDMYRYALQQFAAVRAGGMTAPSITVTAKGSALPGAEYAYSDVAIRDIKDGRIASVRADRINISTSVKHGGVTDRVSGEIAGLTGEDIDMAAAATVLDPAHAADTQFYRVQGRTSMGAYTLNSDQGGKMRLDGVTIGAFKVQPAKFKLQEFLAAASVAKASADIAKTGAVLDRVANLYEAIQIDNTELRGLTVVGPSGPVTLGAMRFTLDRGKVSEFAFEDFDGPAPDGRVKFGRFALKGFDFARLMRQMSHAMASDIGKTPSSDVVLSFLTALDGIELKDMVAPYKGSQKLVHLQTASLDWGQFVGPIPSKARLKLKMTGPIDDNDGEPFTMLRAAGFDDATIGVDLGLAWNESERKLTLDPTSFEIAGLFAVTAQTSFGNVDRALFSPSALQATVMATQIETGTIEIKVRDLGAVDLAVAHYARQQNVSQDTARQAIVGDIRAKSQTLDNASPAASKIADTAASLIETPRGALSVKITPRAKLPVMQLVQLLNSDPTLVPSLFQIDVQSTK